MGQRRFRLRTWRVRIAVGVLVVAVVILAAPLWLPPLIGWTIERGGALEAHVGSVDVHWRKGAISLEDVDLKRAHSGEPVLDAPEVRIDWRTGSLFDWPIRLDVTLPSPRIWLYRSEDGRDALLRFARARVQRLPPIVIDRLVVEDGTVSVEVPQLRRRMVVTDLSLDAHDVTTRGTEGSLPTEARLDGRIAEGGTVAARLESDVFKVPAELEVRLLAAGFPLSIASKATLELAGVKIDEGTGTFALVASVHDGRYHAGVAMQLEKLEVDKPRQAGPATEVGAELLEAGADLLGAFSKDEGIHRSAEFSGRLVHPDAVVTEEFNELLDRSFHELSS